MFQTKTHALGVPLKWLRSAINARWHVNWRKFGAPTYSLPDTDELLRCAYDLKLPPHFEDEDFEHIGKIIVHCAAEVKKSAQPDKD